MVKGFYILIWITVFKLCYCQLRMGLGNESVLGKKYLVYFVKSPYSEAGDEAWLCAGAIVSPTQILTAAACLVDVNRIYAVAGYKKYVDARDIEKDKCTKIWKKKVVKISVPKEYTTSTAKLEWMNVDIGVATVEQPYDFNDQSYLIHCSYIPESITINYDRSIEGENTRAIALGWGGKKAKGNDHGGPLITWTGEEEVILGVALNGICNPNIDCIGPRVYVSTAATADIIKCMLETKDAQRQTCNDEIDDKRYQVNDIEIQWPEDIKTNTTSSMSKQTIPLVRRQNDKEETVQVRPTMDLQSVHDPQNPEDDSPQNPQIKSQENLERGSEEKIYNSRKENAQDDRELNLLYEPQNPKRAGRVGQPVNEELKSQPEIQPKRFITQQQTNQIPPEINNFNRPNPDYQNRPEIDTANQPQMELYNQPPMDTYYNQPASDSYYNHQTKPKNPPETDLFNQPQTIPKNEPPIKPNNQNPIEQNPQTDSFNRPDMEPQKHHQRPIDNHETKSNQPQRQINGNNQQTHRFKPPQEGPEPSQVNLYNQPRIESFGQPQLRKPQVQPPHKPQEHSGTIKSAHSNGKPLGQSQYSNKAPQSSYSEGIQAFDPEPAESYNPLDILMAQNQDEEITFKKPIVKPFKPPPLGRHKLPNVNPYMPQPFKPSIDKPFKQRHLSQQYEPHPPERAPPFRQPIRQPFEPNHPLNALRTQASGHIMHRPQSESQTFEQMFSQLHAEPETVAPAPPHHEETFDEVYRNLHDGIIDEPPEQEFQPRMEQPIEQEVEQTDPRMMNEPPADVEAENVEVQLRQQAPLDYPEYNK